MSENTRQESAASDGREETPNRRPGENVYPIAGTHENATDERIAREVREALEQNADVDASHIQVDVRGGVVLFTGTVDSERTRELAEGCLVRLQGVQRISNQLRVREH